MIYMIVAFVIALMICGTIIGCRMIDEYDLVEWWAANRNFSQIRKIICEKAEVGDHLTDEEMKMLYKLVK